MNYLLILYLIINQNTQIMENSELIMPVLVAFLLGAALTFLLYKLKTKSDLISAKEIDKKEAKILYDNHRNEMGYQNLKDAEFIFSGYFDLNTAAAKDIMDAMDAKKFDNVRVYFSQDRYPSPSQQTFLLNGLSNTGVEEDNGKLFIIRNAINLATDCPKYCEYERAVLH